MISPIAFATIFALVLVLGLGIFSVLRNPKSKITQHWFYLSLVVSIWLAGYIYTLSQSNSEGAYRGLKIVYVGASLIPIFFFHFVTSILLQTSRFKIFLMSGYIVGAFFLILSQSTDLIFTGARYMVGFGYYEDVTRPCFYWFLMYFLVYVGFSIILLMREYMKADGFRRRQLFYIIIASLFGFLGGISNFVADLTGIYPYGQFLVWLYPVLITYGIFIDEVKIKVKF